MYVFCLHVKTVAATGFIDRKSAPAASSAGATAPLYAVLNHVCVPLRVSAVRWIALAFPVRAREAAALILPVVWSSIRYGCALTTCTRRCG